MRVLPEPTDVFIAVHPRLIIGAVCNRRSDLRVTRLWTFVVPVKALAALNIGLQIPQVVNAAPRRISMVRLIPPICGREIIIDANEIYVVISPKRIKVKQPISGAIIRLISPIFRPISCIADLGIRSQNGCNVTNQPNERTNCRKARIWQTPRQFPHLRTHAKRINATGSFAQVSIVQNEPAIATFRRACVVNTVRSWRKIVQRTGAEKVRYGLFRAGRNPAAPRQFRLSYFTIAVR